MEYRCKNGMIDIAIPIIIDGKHLATFFTGQFFYDDDPPDRDFFVKQTAEMGFPPDDYLTALDRVPVFSRKHVQSNLLFLYNMVLMMAEMGMKNLRLAHEMEERKTAQAQLEDERLLLQTLIQTLPDPVWLKDPNGTFLACNGAFGLLFNDTPTGIVGRRDNHYVGDDLATFFQEKDREAIAAGKSSTNEEWLTYASDGRHVLWETTKTPVYDAKGQPVGVLGIARDITKHRLLEDELRTKERYQQALLDNFPFMVWLKDTESRLLAVNRPYLEAANLAVDAPYFGKTDLDLFPADLAEGFRADDREVMATGQQKTVEEFVGTPGMLCWHETYKAPVLDAEGKLLGTVGFSRDITERKQMEKEILKLNAELLATLQTIPDLLFELDPNGTYINVWAQNPSLLAAQKEQLLGRTVHEVLSTEAAEVVMAALHEADENGSSFGKVIRIDFPEGPKWFEHSVSKKCCINGTDRHFMLLSRDITERKRMEETLATREREYRTLAENSPDNIIRYDLDCRAVYYNSTLSKSVDIDHETILGKTPAEAHPDEKEAVEKYEAMIRRVMASGEPNQVEIVVPHPNGELRTHLIHVVAERNDEGSIIGALTIGRDITKIKQAEQRLELMNFALDHVGESAVLVDEQGQLRYVNEGACRTLGYSRDELLALSVADLDPDYPVEAWSGYWQELQKIGSHTFVGQHKAKDGRVFPVEINANYFEFCGQGYNLGLVRDISERKRVVQELQEREQQFRTLAENLPDNIARYDRNCLKVYVNPQLEKTLGRSAVSLVGRAPFDGYGEGFSVYQKTLQQLLADGEDVELDLSVPDAEKGERYHNIRFVAERDTDGTVTGAMVIGRDITERKQIEQALREERNLFVGGPNVAFKWQAVNGWPVDYVSPNIKAQFGYSPEDFTSGRVPYGSIIHPDDQLRVAEEISGYCAASVSCFEQEYRVLHGEGSWCWIYDFTVVVRDTNGAITHFYGYINDITERKQSEETLRRREMEFRALAENSPDPIFRYDRDFRRLYVNQAVATILDKPQEQLIGNTPADGATLVAEQGKIMIAAIRQVFEQNEPGQVEIDFVALDGQHREYQMLLVPEHDAYGQVETVLAIGRDITAIRAVEQRLARSVSNLPGFVYSLHMSPEGEFRFTFVSPGVIQIFGLHQEEVLKVDIRTLLHTLLSPDDLLRIDAFMVESVWNMTPFREEFKVHHSGLSEQWVEVYATPVREQDRSIVWHGIMLDVTDRKQAEEALREREQQFRTLIDNIPDHITGFDAEGRVRYINPAVTRDFGVATDMIAGMTLEELSAAGAAPEGSQFPTALRRAFEERTSNSMEAIWQTLHGKRLFEVRHIPELNADGAVTGVLGIARDITERMEMEASLRKSRHLLAEAQRIAHVGSWELDLATNRLTWSDEVFRIFEIDPTRPDASYQEFLDRIHPDDRGIVDQAYQESTRNRTPYSIEHRLLFPDGRIKYIQERCETFYSADGVPLRSMGIAQDITDRKQAEENLLTKQRKLAELELELSFAEERERQRIAAVLHDHIGQLLLLGRIKLGALLSNDQPPATEQTVSDVRTLMDEAIQSTRSLTVQLCPPVLSTMGLEPALELLCRQMLEEWGLQVAFSDDLQPKPLSPEVRTVLYQTARELLINVGKHACTKHAQLAISRDDAMFVMIVSDSGTGFDPDALAAASRQAKGFGLFNVMRRIRNLGGEMTMDSSPLQGTHITIRMSLEGCGVDL